MPCYTSPGSLLLSSATTRAQALLPQPTPGWGYSHTPSRYPNLQRQGEARPSSPPPLKQNHTAARAYRHTHSQLTPHDRRPSRTLKPGFFFLPPSHPVLVTSRGNSGTYRFLSLSLSRCLPFLSPLPHLPSLGRVAGSGESGVTCRARGDGRGRALGAAQTERKRKEARTTAGGRGRVVVGSAKAGPVPFRRCLGGRKQPRLSFLRSSFSRLRAEEEAVLSRGAWVFPSAGGEGQDCWI